MGKLVQLNDQEASLLWSKLAYYESPQYVEWNLACQANRSFYVGDQYTEEERELLAERGQYDIVINKVRKAIRGMSGLVSSSVPKYHLLASGADDDAKAAIGNKLLDWCWQNSGGVSTFRKAIKTALIDNISYLHVVYSHDRKVKFEVLTFDDVIVDPTSQHDMFEDAEMIIIRKYISVEIAKQLYGVTEIVHEAPGYFATVNPNFLGTDGNFLGRVFSDDKQYVRVYECYMKEPYRNDKGDIVRKLKKKTALGFRHVYEEELPLEITEFPIIPLYVEGGGNPYKLGEVQFLKELQKFINKAFAVTLLNAQLMSNPKVVTRSQYIPIANRTQFEQNMSKPGAIITLDSAEDSPFFTIIGGQPLNNAFYTLYNDAKMEFEYNTMPAQLLGYNDSSQYQTQSSLLDRKETVMDSFKDLLSIIDLACCKLGRVCLQYVQAYVGKETAIRVLNADKHYERIERYRKQGLDVNDHNSVQQFIQYQKQQQVPDEEIESMLSRAKDDSDYVESLSFVIDNTDFSDFDIQVIAGSYTQTYDMAMLRLMMELARIGAVDPSSVLAYAPVEDRKSLIERSDQLRRSQSQIETLTEENEYLKSVARKAQESNTQMEQDVISEKFVIKQQKIFNMATLRAMMMKYKTALDKDEMLAKFYNELQRLIIESNMNIQQAELDQKNKIQNGNNANVNSMLTDIFNQ